jgi:hypothetical protein
VVSFIVIPFGINQSPDKSTPKEIIKMSWVLTVITFLDLVRINTKISRKT